MNDVTLHFLLHVYTLLGNVHVTRIPLRMSTHLTEETGPKPSSAVQDSEASATFNAVKPLESRASMSACAFTNKRTSKISPPGGWSWKFQKTAGIQHRSFRSFKKPGFDGKKFGCFQACNSYPSKIEWDLTNGPY